jgi:hypothetical protein
MHQVQAFEMMLLQKNGDGFLQKYYPFLKQYDVTHLAD